MPRPDDVATPASPSPRETQAPPLSRRSMLRSAAGASAAGLAITTLAASPALAASQHALTANAPEHVPDHIASGEAVVVHVLDVRSGEMDIYRGTSHVRVQDRALAARLARASL